jgi:hypothetical protein
MFDLEKSIADWRLQMRVAGLKTAVPLEELELHLREDIDRLIESGLGEKAAFELATRQLGQPQILKSEFKKNGTAAGKKLGIFALAACVLMILHVLYVHGHTGLVWVLFPATGVAVLSWVANTAFFNFSLEEVREVRFWKLAAMTFSAIAVWVSLLPVGEHLMNWPRFAARFGTADRFLTLVAVAASILSVFVWRYGRGILPVISNRRTRNLVGIICCLSGPAAIASVFYCATPWLGRIPAPLFFILWPWVCTAIAILAGAGYGLSEAAHRQKTTAIAS